MILMRATSPTAGRSGGYPVAAALPARPYIALPIITIGFLGWMSVLYLAVRRGGIALALSSAGYFALVVAYVIPVGEEQAIGGSAGSRRGNRSPAPGRGPGSPHRTTRPPRRLRLHG
jgi:hypothetical protein